MSVDRDMKKDNELAVKDQPSMLVISEEVVDTYMQTSQMLTEKFKEWLIPEVDFTTKLFGRRSKPALLDPGSSKLIGFFQCRPRHRLLERFSDEDEEGYAHIRYVVACELLQGSTGRVVAEGVGSCCSDEKKYKYRWYFASELEKRGIIQEERHKLPTRLTGGGATQYQARNPEIPDLDNTLFKMAAKRAAVDACLQLPGVAAVFTQDVGDYKTVQPSDKPRHVDSVQRDITPNEMKAITAEQLKTHLEGVFEGVVLDVVDNGTHFTATPTKFLGDSWGPVNDAVKSLGGQWNKDEQDKTQSHWWIPKEDSEKPPEEPEKPSKEPEPKPKGEGEEETGVHDSSRQTDAAPGKEETPAPEPSEKEPPQGPSQSIEDVIERIEAFLPGWSDLIKITDRGDYYRIGRIVTLDEGIEVTLDHHIAEMGGEFNKEKNEWRVPKET